MAVGEAVGQQLIPESARGRHVDDARGPDAAELPARDREDGGVAGGRAFDAGPRSGDATDRFDGGVKRHVTAERAG